jgi:hypothetical protein
MKNTYCVWCLSYGLRSSARYRLGIALTDEAREIYRSPAPEYGVRIGSITYTRIEEGMSFPYMQAFVDFIELYGNQFMYLDTVGAPIYPVAVATYQGNSVCTQHLPNFERYEIMIRDLNRYGQYEH